MSISKKPRLGRGLSSLINTPVQIDPPVEAAQSGAAEPAANPRAGQGGGASNSAPTAATKKTPSTAGTAASTRSPGTPGASGAAGTPPAAQSRQPATPTPTSAASPSPNTQSAAKTSTNTTTPATEIKPDAQDNEHRSLQASTDQDSAGPRLIYLPIDAIVPNLYQPRQQFDQAALSELAASIRQAGLMQPVLVRPASQKSITDYLNKLQNESVASESAPTGSTTGTSQNKSTPAPGQSMNIVHSAGVPGTPVAPAPASANLQLYELVAGERRWRAARLAGLKVIPAVIHQLGDQQLAEWAVIENLQRENLNPIDQAQAFRRLTSEFGLTQLQLADRLGIGRVTITNTLRLLELEDFILAALRQGQLTAGHGRALLAIPDAELRMNLGRRAIHGDWSVRTLETTARRLAGVPATASGQGAPPAAVSPRQAHMKDLESQIGQQLQTRVRLRTGKKKGAGAITIEFFSIDQFDQLLERLQIRLT